MDDALAMESGARVLGSVGDVFVNADGYKKSIPGPGIGNYVTVAKAMAAARGMLGEDGLRTSTYMHAHGTGTPQNRVTESAIMSEVAKGVWHTQFEHCGNQILRRAFSGTSGRRPALGHLGRMAGRYHSRHQDH